MLYVGASGHTANLDEDGSYVARMSAPFGFNGSCTVLAPTLGGEPNRAARLGATVAAVHKQTAQSSNTEVAFGAPFADLGANNNAGLVATHESDGHEGVYSQFSWPPAGGSDHDHFGAAIVAGDFDGDGDDDFIFAAPDKDAASGNDIGRLYELLNLAAGVTPDSIFEQGDLGANTSETGDQFGAALAAGYINGDRFQDLVIGVPGEECCADDGNEGFVAVMFGSATGLTTSGFLQFRQQDIGGTMTPEARFGSAVAAGDFNHDGLDEIVIGAPDHPVSGHDAAGKVFLRFSPGTPATTGVNLTLNFNGAENLPDKPLPSPAFSGDTATVTFTGGPIEHVERLFLSVTYPTGVDVEQVPGAWNCRPSQLSPITINRTMKCRFDGSLFLGATSPPLQFSWLVDDGGQTGSITRSAVQTSMTVERSPANNSDSLTAAIAQSPGIFLNGFE